MFTTAMNLFGRDTDASQQSTGINPTMVTLVVVLLALLVVTLILVATLFLLRQRRRARKQAILPEYNEKRLSDLSNASNHRRGRARQLEPVHVQTEKMEFLNNSSSPPDSPLPEIRITFPEEIDASGKRKSGRVVVVHVGDTAVGLEPVEALPAYQKNEGERFDSIDLERIGGLVEKARNAPK